MKLHEGCQARRLAAQQEEISELLPKMIALRKCLGCHRIRACLQMFTDV